MIFIYCYLFIGLVLGILMERGIKKTKEGESESLDDMRKFYDDRLIIAVGQIALILGWPYFVLDIIFDFNKDKE